MSVEKIYRHKKLLCNSVAMSPQLLSEPRSLRSQTNPRPSKQRGAVPPLSEERPKERRGEDVRRAEKEQACFRGHRHWKLLVYPHSVPPLVALGSEKVTKVINKEFFVLIV